MKIRVLSRLDDCPLDVLQRVIDVVVLSTSEYRRQYCLCSAPEPEYRLLQSSCSLYSLAPRRLLPPYLVFAEPHPIRKTLESQRFGWLLAGRFARFRGGLMKRSCLSPTEPFFSRSLGVLQSDTFEMKCTSPTPISDGFFAVSSFQKYIQTGQEPRSGAMEGSSLRLSIPGCDLWVRRSSPASTNLVQGAGQAFQAIGRFCAVHGDSQPL